MSWTSPITWVDGDLVTAAQLNAQLRDNTTYLKNRAENVGLYNSTSTFNYTGVAATVAITGASITLTPTCNRVRIMITAAFINSGGTGSVIRLAYNLNGGAAVLFTQHGSHANDGITGFYHSATVVAYVTVTAGVSTVFNAMVNPYNYGGSSTTAINGITMIVEGLVDV
jgi:hypothetical protein